MTFRPRRSGGGERLFFEDRVDAGRRLAPLLTHLKVENPVVLGLPRGGVPVAREVAKALDAPLDVILVRKLGVPWQPELAMGAIGEGGVRVVNRSIVRSLGIDEEEIEKVQRAEETELDRRARMYRGDREMLDLEDRTAVVVDDGIATGATAEAACAVARAHGARRIVMAAPVAAPSARSDLLSYVDEVICLDTPEHFGAIGVFYRDFSPTTDDEVRSILAAAGSSEGGGDGAPELASIKLKEVTLPGRLAIPAGARSVVVFAHGSGSSMNSPRNRQVAAYLNRLGHGTLLFDLLTDDESRDRRNVFDIPLLARRLESATEWLLAGPGAGMSVGFFGASTGAAAALEAAATVGSGVRAVVSRGGRPDLARRLGSVLAPTLLIVGGRDHQVLDLNREAAAQLSCPHELEIVPGATHLFEEPGALDAVAELAGEWFDRHLT